MQLGSDMQLSLDMQLGFEIMLRVVQFFKKPLMQWTGSWEGIIPKWVKANLGDSLM